MSLIRTFLPASGAISMENAAGADRSIRERFGGARTHRMSEYYGIGVNTANATLPASGPLRFSDFYNRTEMITTSLVTTTSVTGPGLFAPQQPGSPAQFTGGQEPSQGSTQTQSPVPGVPALFNNFFNPGSQFGFIPFNGQVSFFTIPGQPSGPQQSGSSAQFTETQPGTTPSNTTTEFLTRVAPEPGA